MYNSKFKISASLMGQCLGNKVGEDEPQNPADLIFVLSSVRYVIALIN